MKREDPAGSSPGPSIDRLIHEPVRLKIMVMLGKVEETEFLSACDRMAVTRGNFSSHMSRLADAGYIVVKKEFVGRIPMTRMRITIRGKEALDTYISVMQTLLSGK